MKRTPTVVVVVVVVVENGSNVDRSSDTGRSENSRISYLIGTFAVIVELSSVLSIRKLSPNDSLCDFKFGNMCCVNHFDLHASAILELCIFCV